MVDSRLQAGCGQGYAQAGTESFVCLGAGSMAGNSQVPDVTEANTQLIYRTAGVLVNLEINCTARTSSVVIHSRKGGVNQNNTVTTAGTGITEDIAHQDTVTAADLWNYDFSALTAVYSYVAMTFQASGIACSRLFTRASLTHQMSSTSQTFDQSLSSVINTTAGGTETQCNTSIRKACILKNGAVNITTDNGAGAGSGVTYRTRVGGANANLSIAVVKPATGIIEDTTNQDSRSVGDLANWQAITSSTPVNVIMSYIAIDLQSTAGNSMMQTGGIGAPASSGAATRILLFACDGFQIASGTETQGQLTARDAFTCSQTGVNISANTGSGTNTWRFRKNAGNGNQTFTFTTATGVINDTTNTDTMVATDKINISFTTVSTTTCTLAEWWEWFNLPSSAVVYPGAFSTVGMRPFGTRNLGNALGNLSNVPPMFTTF